MDERVVGVVKSWLDGLGYGFIRPENGKTDVFCHANDLDRGRRSLEPGQVVEFNIVMSKKGLQARGVTVL